MKRLNNCHVNYFMLSECLYSNLKLAWSPTSRPCQVFTLNNSPKIIGYKYSKEAITCFKWQMSDNLQDFRRSMALNCPSSTWGDQLLQIPLANWMTKMQSRHLWRGRYTLPQTQKAGRFTFKEQKTDFQCIKRIMLWYGIFMHFVKDRNQELRTFVQWIHIYNKMAVNV